MKISFTQNMTNQNFKKILVNKKSIRKDMILTEGYNNNNNDNNNNNNNNNNNSNPTVCTNMYIF